MVFSSAAFLFFFFPFCMIIYYLLQGKIRNYWLLIASLFFYFWGGPGFFPIMLFSILLNYAGGAGISCMDQKIAENEYSAGNEKKYHAGRKIWTILIIGCNISLLFYWKYLNFFASAADNIFHTNWNPEPIILPIGISFFTFQGLSYVVDVYRKQVPAQKNILYVGLYIAMFPQLIAGPIVRYDDIYRELTARKVNVTQFAGGMRRFSAGLAKKVIIANTLAVNADAIFMISPERNTVPVAWIGIISYTLQIYYDFSGYSDMAIGMGQMLGFHFPENFNYPYAAVSITDFWRRWHMSLSSWFRDYVYIPLGGNRCSKYRWFFNLLAVWSLTGIWHGANWTFLIWGWIYFLLLLFEKIVGVPRKASMISRLYTIFFVMIAWVFFKADSIGHAFRYLKSMFGLAELQDVVFYPEWYLNRYQIFIIIVACIGAFPILKWMAAGLKTKISANAYILFSDIACLALFGISVMHVMTSTYNPFIYFQF